MLNLLHATAHYPITKTLLVQKFSARAFNNLIYIDIYHKFFFHVHFNIRLYLCMFFLAMES